MKNLELNQMEKVEGGNWSCVAAIGGIALTAVAIVGGGPVGWLAWSAFIGRGFIAGGSLGACIYEEVNG